MGVGTGYAAVSLSVSGDGLIVNVAYSLRVLYFVTYIVICCGQGCKGQGWFTCSKVISVLFNQEREYVTYAYMVQRRKSTLLKNG